MDFGMVCDIGCLRRMYRRTEKGTEVRLQRQFLAQEEDEGGLRLGGQRISRIHHDGESCREGSDETEY
jgi:hypothetical protein